jgi:hypothetical protein
LLKTDDISSVKQGQGESSPLSYFLRRRRPRPPLPLDVAFFVVSVGAAVGGVSLATSKAGASCRSVRCIVLVKVPKFLRRNSNQHLLLSF